MTPSECMRSFVSGSWLEDETTGEIRRLAGADGKSAAPAGGEEAAADGGKEEGTDITPAEALNAVKVEGKSLLSEMHEAAMKTPHNFEKCLNYQELNRIASLYCYDYNRVKISEDHGKGDYYHASHVDGYSSRGTYIFAQAPFDDDTERIFWRMVVDQKPSMILVFGVIDERQKRKTPMPIADPRYEKTVLQEFNAKSLAECEEKARICRTFWADKGGEKTFEKLAIKTTDELSETHMKTFELLIKDGSGEEPKTSVLMHFHEWGEKNDDELPEYMLDMRASIKVQKIRLQKNKAAYKGPTMLVCATGVAKCAIYATIDIIVTRMTEEHTVGFMETMTGIMSQRYGAFRSSSPYLTAREMLMKFAVSTGVVHDAAIGDKPKSVRSKHSKTKPGKPTGVAGKMKAATIRKKGKK